MGLHWPVRLALSCKVVGLAVLWSVVPALADENKIPAAVLSPADAGGAELVDLFVDFCLNRFPAAASLDEGAAERKATAMTADQARRYLHANPGRGWIVNTALATYMVTIEDPPSQTCVIRNRYAAALKIQSAYQLAVKSWAATNKIGPVLDERPKPHTDIGLDISAMMTTVPDAAGRPLRHFIVLTTTYPDGKVEIQAVHQLLPAPRNGVTP